MSDSQVKSPTATPTKMFDRPADVLNAKLSHAEKVAVLKQWELDARLLQTASEEGMSGGEPNMLADVKAALAKLGAVSATEDAGGGPSKTGM
jgi:hypothetical protein